VESLHALSGTQTNKRFSPGVLPAEYIAGDAGGWYHGGGVQGVIETAVVLWKLVMLSCGAQLRYTSGVQSDPHDAESAESMTHT
jgi:hypothetical protein